MPLFFSIKTASVVSSAVIFSTSLAVFLDKKGMIQSVWGIMSSNC